MNIVTYLSQFNVYNYMPSGAPIIRAMDWGLALERLPDEISYFLPHGDPIDNHTKIKKEIKRLKSLGPKGRYEMEKFVQGYITEEEFESNIDSLFEVYDVDELEKLRTNLSNIERSMNYNTYRRIMPFISTFDMGSKEFKESIKNINQITLVRKDREKVDKTLA